MAREIEVLEELIRELIQRSIRDNKDYKRAFEAHEAKAVGAQQSRRQDSEWPVDIMRHVFLLRRELDVFPARLLGKESEVWSAWDRLRSEGEFRDAISTTLVSLVFVLTVVSSPLWLCALPACALLWSIGTKKWQEARSLLIEGVRAGRLDARELDRAADPERVEWRETRSYSKSVPA
jgi:hypothetical protein